MEKFDVAIIGGTIEGMSAALCCCEKGLSTVVIEKMDSGAGSLEEFKLIRRLKDRALESGVTFIATRVHSLWGSHVPKIIYTEEGPIGCDGVILAMGVFPKKLGLPLESHFHGRGLHYQDSCTSSYLKGKTVAVYGSNMAAFEHAITLSALCKRVYLICTEGKPECNASAMDVIRNKDNLILLPHTLIRNIKYRHKGVLGIEVSGVEIVDKTTENTASLDCEILYICDGNQPDSKLCFPYIVTDEDGFIITDENRKTNLDGVYAAGKICSSVIGDESRIKCPMDEYMAATDGAIAAINVVKYVAGAR